MSTQSADGPRPAGRLLPGGPGVRFATALARRPHRVAHRATILAGDLAHVGLGRSTLAAAPADRRFTDPDWTANPLLRRLVQAYLAAGRTAEGLVADADLEWRDAQQVRLLVDNMVQALAPSNQPLTSPIFELLQYRPRTPRVRRVPLLVIPPTINKYYILDLAPGRSLVEYLADSGQQVFVVSWRNPDAATATGAPTPTGRRSWRRWRRPGGSAGSTDRRCWGCARVGSWP